MMTIFDTCAKEVMEFLNLKEYQQLHATSTAIAKHFPSVTVAINVTQCMALKKGTHAQCTNKSNQLNGHLKVCGNHTQQKGFSSDTMASIWNALPITWLVKKAPTLRCEVEAPQVS